MSAHSAASSLIRHCAQRRVAVIVSARSVDEAKAAWDHGASAVKLECGSGGPRLTRAVSGEHPVIPVIAAGDIDDRTAREHIQAGTCAVAVGQWLLGDAAEGQNVAAMATRARSLVAAVTAAALQRSGL